MFSIIKTYINKNKGPLVYSALSMGLSFALVFFTRKSTGFSLWYGENITPFFVNTFGRSFSLMPFSVFEFLLYGLALLLPLGLLTMVLIIIFKPRLLKKYLSGFLHGALCLLASLLMMFSFTAAANYSRPPLTAGLDSTASEHSDGQLLGLALLLVDDITALTESINIDENGFLQIDENTLGKDAAKAMKDLSPRYPSLSGYYPEPKPVYGSKAMSYLGITGIFSPFTMEANYNKDVPSYIIPYTICHELAHLKGFMKEDEAGFLAYLASAHSDSAEFRYSGALNALIYTLNGLYNNVDRDIYEEVYFSIPERVRNEMANSRSYWNKYTNTATTVAKAANDKYLMANAQSNGTKSYGMMVDLMLNEYRQTIKESYGELIPPQLLDNGANHF